MIRSFITIAIRNLVKFKAYTFINLIGLSLGLTAGLLILLYVIDELSFDQFHERLGRLYRVETQGGEIADGAMDTNGWPVGKKILNDYPEVEAVVYTRNGSNLMVNHEGKRFEHNAHYASKSFFELFSFELTAGDANTALDKPYSVVITETMKSRYFGSSEAVGKSLTFADTLDFTITAVVADPPQQSHIQFDMLFSFSTYEQINPYFNYSEGWGNINVRNYVLLKENVNVNALESKIGNLYMDNVGDWLSGMGMELYVRLQPVEDLYLSSKTANGFGPSGSIDRLYLTSSIAFFIIILACINFINLTTARSVYRAKEVGLRKIVGSSRTSVFWQFLVESLAITLLAFVLAIIMVDLSLPAFNYLMGKQFSFGTIFSSEIMTSAILLVISVAFLAGYYPATVLSGYKPIDTLKVKLQSGKKGIKLRKSLVVFQFVVSAGLVVFTLIVLEQLQFMRTQELGFDKARTLILDVTRIPQNAKHIAFQNSLKSLASINQVSKSNALPGRPGWQGQWAYPEGKPEDEYVETEYMAIDEHYVQTLGLELIAGRNFDKDRTSDLEDGLIINEAAMLKMGWVTPEAALGKKITSPSHSPEGKIIGVVKDYHGLGLQQQIWPKVMDYRPQIGRYYAIKYNADRPGQLIASIQKQWGEYFGDYTFEYFFLDEDFNNQYRSEERLSRVFSVFSAIAIIIAVIGLFGMVSFMVNAHNKEIGVRKVLGATVLNITKLLSTEFIILVILGNLIAAPLCWYFGNEWLKTFAYRLDLKPGLFLITLSATLFIALAAVSLQTIKAALSNPVDTLRSE